MKKGQKNNLKSLQYIYTSSNSPPKSLLTSKKNSEDCSLPKEILQQIQLDLQNIHGFFMTNSSLVVLSNYYAYHSLLKNILFEKQEEISHKKSVERLTKHHSEDKLSRMLSQLHNKSELITKNRKLYGRQSLIHYFHLEQYQPSLIVRTLTQKIVQGKRKGLIEFEQKKKKKKTIFNQDLKENKSAFNTCLEIKLNSQPISQSHLYFSILALKMRLKEFHLNSEEINKICDQIKAGLQECICSIKLRQKIKPTNLKRGSIFRKL